MDIENIIERARVLINLNRKKEAVKQLHEALAYEPNNLYVIQLLCSCYYDLGNYKESLERAQEMISLSPDEALGYYFLAINYGVLDKNELALKNIDIAISLDPWDADYFAYKAALYVDEKEWEKVIETTNEALEIDPEHTNSLNHRITALTKLNRKDEILTHVEEVLASDPDNAYSHSTIGWSKLETKEYQEAQKHFAEALRIDPNSDRARIGMTNAIKGTNFLYSLVLSYSFWVNNHKGNIGWGIGIGVFVLSRFLKVLAAVSPIFLLLFIAIFALIYFSWILNPISNLILKYDKFGKYLLTKDETKAVNIVSIGLILGVVFITVGVIFSSTFFYYLSFIAFTLIIPFSNYYDSDEQEQTKRFLYYCYGLAALVVISLLIFFIDYNISFGFGIAYLIGVIAYTWVKPFLAKV
jgi:tetratricopeptide (TPR) repeat protein